MSSKTPPSLTTRLLAAVVCGAGIAPFAAAGPPGVPAVATAETEPEEAFVLRWSDLPESLQSLHRPVALRSEFADTGIAFARHGDWLVAVGPKQAVQRLRRWHGDARVRIGDAIGLECTIQHVPAGFVGSPATGEILTGEEARGFLALTDAEPTTIIDRRRLATTSGESVRWPARLGGNLEADGLLSVTGGDRRPAELEVELEIGRGSTMGRRTDRVGHRFAATLERDGADAPIVLFSRPFREASVRAIDGTMRRVPLPDERPEDVIALTLTRTAAPAAESPVGGDLYRDGPATPDGIGRYFFGREIAQVMGHMGAGWLERANREREERTDVLLEHLDIAPGTTIADIGAGSGYYTRRLARLTGADGRVVATDIQPEMLLILDSKLKEEGIENVEPRLGAIDDCGLAPRSVDLILLVDVYHEFDHPWEMLRSMRRALGPAGRVALVEYRANDPRVPIKPLHTMTAEQSRLEFEAAGFTLVGETEEGLPWQRVQFFEAAPTASGR